MLGKEIKLSKTTSLFENEEENCYYLRYKLAESYFTSVKLTTDEATKLRNFLNKKN